MKPTNHLLDSSIEFLKGVGPAKAQLLNKELSVFTLGDLLQQYPHRYIDKTKFYRIADLSPDGGWVQLRGILRRVEKVGEGRKQRLTGIFRDASGSIDLVWFSGIHFLEQSLVVGQEYVLYGRINDFNGQLNIPHPELEVVSDANTREASAFAPVYPSTEKLNQKGLDARARRRMMQSLLERLEPAHLPEMLPPYLCEQLQLPDRFTAFRHIHFPSRQEELDAARLRLKFEELFLLQLRLLQLNRRRREQVIGYIFDKIGEVFNRFFYEVLPFPLTNAQKRVLREIRRDLGSGRQMNRLLQGDVGSGKTVVGLMSMLMAIDNGFQACLMAPTEILAQQHFLGISELAAPLGLRVAFLSGSVKGKARKEVLQGLAAGDIHILIGTHALIEPVVVFQRLGLAIIDEQHRFGVEQRAKLWAKSKPYPPHILIMTATPIPRTLAMTLYGDLDVSVIDELPPGRKPVKTVHYTEHHRNRVLGFVRDQIAVGRQVYVVYPLIEENEKLDLLALEQGHAAICRDFPPPNYQVSVVHGRMKAADKEFEMQRFKKGETHIMVATTVIEVGVNVPNASVMVIENTERFGLSQLHQLRGRVGRGAEQSFCILMSGFKLSQDSRERIQTMVRTNNGFEIAEADLRLRGPGNVEGTQQSGLLNLRIADLARDGQLVQLARAWAEQLLDADPMLSSPQHLPLGEYLERHFNNVKGWGRIS